MKPLKIVFFRSDKTRERIVADAFVAGVNTQGDQGSIISDSDSKRLSARETDIEVAVTMGISRGAKRSFEEFLAAGRHAINRLN